MPVSFTLNRVTNFRPLTGDQDGDGYADAGDVLRHTLTIHNTGDTAATSVVLNDLLGGSTETGLMNISPIAFDDAFTAVGNTALRVGGAANIGAGPSSVVAGNLLANDVGSTTVGVGPLAADDVTGFTIDTVTNQLTAGGGRFSIFADGSFNYISEAGDQGTDSFTYTIRDAGIDGVAGNSDDTTSTATVTITITGQVWYVDSAAAGGGTGTSANPFNSITALQGANVDGANDYVYVKGNATGQLVMETGEHLIGEGAGLDVASFHLADAGTRSTITNNTAGFGVTLAGGGAGNNEIAGINLVSTGGAGNHALTGTSFGTLNISNTTIDASGQGLILSTGAIAGTGLVSTDSDGGTNNVSLTGITGTLALGTGALSGATGTAFNVSGGTVSATYGGNISQATAGQALVSVAGGHATGTLNFNTGTLSATNGTGLQFNNADGTYNFNGTNTLNGGDAGVDIIAGSDGTFFFSSNTSITNPTGVAFNVNGGTGSIDYNGTITKNTDGQTISVVSHTGGTVSFDGTVSSTAASDGINFATNTGAVIHLSNTLTINTSASNTAGFAATGGGTIDVTGSGNTINSGTATALNISNTNIGASNVTFQSVSSSGGSGDGIIIDTVGAAGGLRITGTGGAGSGGTIANKTGADGSTTQGTGIYLNGVTDVQINSMQLNGFQNHGIRGNNVTNFILNNTIINGINGTTAAGGSEEGAMRFDGLFGRVSITNSTLGGVGGGNTSFSDDLRITNSNGTLERMIIDNVHFGDIGSGGNNGLTVTGNSTATMNFSVTNSFFTNAIGSLASVTANNSTTMDAVFRNNAFSNNNVNQSSGGGNLVIQGGSGATNVSYDISSNTFRDAVGIAVLVATGNGGVKWTGRIDGNTIGIIDGTPGTAPLTGSTQASGIKVKATGTGTHTTVISNNTVHETNEEGIYVQANDGSATLNATIIGNVVDRPGSFSFAGLNIDVGALATDTVVVNAVVGSSVLAAQKNDFSAGDPSNFSDVNLSRIAGAGTQLNLSTAGSASGTAAAIIDDDNLNPATTTTSASGTVNIVSAATYRVIATPASVYEDGATNITYIFTRYGNTSGAVTIAFNVGGTAVFGTDYTQSGAATFTTSTGSVTFAAGSATAIVTLDPTADGGIEANDTITLTITSAGAATPTGATTTIIDDDTPLLQAGSSPDPTGKGAGDGTGGDLPPPTPGDSGGSNPDPNQQIVVDDGVLSQAELNLIVNAAIDRWAAAGATPEQIAAMRAVTFSVENLPGLSLGQSTAGHTTIDSNAAGFSWFIDATPGDDVEYSGTGTQLTAAQGTQAGVRIDLLTTIAHELGHQIGLGHDGDSSDLMYGTINPGERRLPGNDDVTGASGVPLTGTAFALSPVSLGTIPAGRIVVVQWDSTVNAFTNQIVPTFNNTSSISGGNFVTATSNTEVFGPTSAPIALDSVTLGNLVFLDANNNGLFDGSDTGINGVALTLFADTNANGVFDSGIDVQLGTTTTAGGGLYSFANLAPGDYIVRVDAANFTGGGALVSRVTSIGGSDPDNNTNNDDNGADGAGGIVVSQAITLTQDGETTADGTGKLDINNTLDFGFVQFNQPPVNTVPGTQTINEDATLTFTGGTAISVNDPDVGAGNLTVTLSVVNGQLTLSGTAGLAFGAGDGTDDTSMTITGTQAAINAALNGLLYETTLDFNGSDTLTIVTNDNGNTGADPGTSGGANDEQDTDTVTINITAVADIVTDTPTVGEDSGANNLNLLGNDTFENPGRSITSVTQGLHGFVAINDNNTVGNTTDDFVVYTPAGDYNGADTFTYTVTSGGVTEVGTVNVTVTAVADIADDTSTVAEDSGTTTIDVIANDSFENGGFSITAVTQGLHGTVTIIDGPDADANPDYVTYTPNADYNGSDSFTYTVTSGGVTETATVNVTVTAVADIVDDSVGVIQDSGVNALDLLANDTFENAGRAITAVGAALHGTTAIDTHGNADPTDDSVTYMPTAGYIGPDTFTYTVTSPAGVTETATVTVNVAPINAAPVIDLNGAGAGIDDTANYTENAGPVILASGVTVSDADDTNIESAAVSIGAGFHSSFDYLTVNGATNGTITGITFNYVAATGILTLTGTATLADYQAVLAQVGFESTSEEPGTSRLISWTVNDGTIDSAAATTTVTVTEVNDAPSGTNATIAMSEDVGHVMVAGDFGFSDVDGDNFAGVVITTLPTAGVLIYDSDGPGGLPGVLASAGQFVTAAQLANGDLIYSAGSNGNGSPFATFTFQVRDDGGTAATGQDTDQSANTITFNVTPINDTPVLTVASPLAATEQTAATIDSSATVHDADLDALNAGAGDYAGSTLSIARNGGAAAEDQLTFAASGAFTVNGSNLEAGGLVFGTFSGGNGTALSISFDSSATIATTARVNAVLDAIRYTNTSDTPPASLQLDILFNDGSPGHGQGSNAVNIATADVLVTVNITAVDDTPVAQPDTITTDEATTLNGSVFSNNGSGPDTDPDSTLTVSAVNGSGGNVGTQITLASGALLKLNADGTFTYNPNHVFDPTPTAGSGAINTPAHDSFSYTLAGGNTVMVSVNVNGLDSDDNLIAPAGPGPVSGGIGNDVYHIIDSGTLVLENNGAGNDRIITSASYILGGDSFVETLEALANLNPINLTGNYMNNTLIGNNGDNRLHGAGGVDTLIGMGGNDIYFTDVAATQVNEAVGGGSDQLYTSVSYVLNGSEIELLSTNSHAATTAINLTGNNFNQTLLGNAGANVLHGGGGTDVLIGYGGNDVYLTDVASTQALEAVGGGSDQLYTSVSYVLTAGSEIELLSTNNTAASAAINLTGNEFANVLYGNAGANILDGKGGNDDLVGLAGVDTFAFTSALGAGNVDQIYGYQAGVDKFALDHNVFTGLGVGALAPGAFVVGTAAGDADDRIIYDQANGSLYFDADGNGAGAAVLFAHVAGGTVLTASDFSVI